MEFSTNVAEAKPLTDASESVTGEQLNQTRQMRMYRLVFEKPLSKIFKY